MASPSSVVRIAPGSEEAILEELVETLCRAFEQDAHINWIIRQDSRRPLAFRQFFRLLLTDLLGSRGELYATTDLKAAAICFPPGVKSLSLLAQARVGGRFAAITGWQSLLIRAYGLNRIEAMHPDLPHYFLQTLGVAPEQQRQGHGSALLRAILNRCDRDGVATYLETSRQDNLGFYERYGFKVLATATLPRGPRLWQLLRRP